MIRFRFAAGLSLAVCMMAQSATSEWRDVRTVAGVDIQSRKVENGLDRHRGARLMCAPLEVVVAYVREASSLPDWVPYTEELQLLEREELRVVYYLRTGMPWPFRSRDMIYELVSTVTPDGSGMQVVMTGRPGYLPEVTGVVRLASVAGEWLFQQTPAGVRVELQMEVDAGEVPKFLGNRRLATTVGLTLANLGEQFPCED